MPDQAPGTEQQMDVFSTLVGEGKKFKDQNSLAIGKVEADSYIEKLKDENKTLRELLTTTAETKVSPTDTTAVQAILAKLTQKPTTSTTGDTPPAQSSKEANPATALTRDDVRKLLEDMERAKTAQENMETVTKAMLARFGEQAKVDEVVKQRASELGVSEDTLKSLATSAPKAYLSMLGFEPNEATGGSLTARSAVNTSAIPGNTGVRNYAYYEKLKSEMGIRKYIHDAKLQVQLFKDMQSLGNKFWQAP